MQHVLILRCMYMYVCMYVCMYLCQSRLGPAAYQVTSYASAACVSRGYMVCARTRVAWLHGLCPHACRVVTWFVPARVSRGYMVCARTRVAWLHGLPSPSLVLALALPRVTGSTSFNAVAFLVN